MQKQSEHFIRKIIFIIRQIRLLPIYFRTQIKVLDIYVYRIFIVHSRWETPLLHVAYVYLSRSRRPVYCGAWQVAPSFRKIIAAIKSPWKGRRRRWISKEANEPPNPGGNRTAPGPGRNIREQSVEWVVTVSDVPRDFASETPCWLSSRKTGTLLSTTLFDKQIDPCQ